MRVLLHADPLPASIIIVFTTQMWRRALVHSTMWFCCTLVHTSRFYTFDDLFPAGLLLERVAV